MANFRTLQHFIQQENATRRLFKRPEWPMDVRSLTQKQADEIFQSLDSNMSPEHLHMDGEISAAQARKRAKIFRGAFDELCSAGFQPSERLWCLQ